MTRQYELMVLLKPEFDAESIKKREEVVKKLLGDGVTLKEVTSLGKKQLTYPIKKQTDAVYLLAHIEAEKLSVGDIEKKSKLVEEVLRWLVVA